LSMREIAKRVLDLLLLKVNSFMDIFRKLSNIHVFVRPYWSVSGAMRSLPFCSFSAFRPPLRIRFFPNGWSHHLGWSGQQLDSLHSIVFTSTFSRLKNMRHKCWWLLGFHCSGFEG
jgi:hypothetical protein